MRIRMHNVAVYSEMVFTGFNNNRFIFNYCRMALLLERYIQQPDFVL